MKTIDMIKLVSQIPQIQEKIAELLRGAGDNLSNLKVIIVQSTDWTKDESSNIYTTNVQHDFKTENIICFVYDSDDSIVTTGVTIVDENNIKLSNDTAIDCKVLFPYALISSGEGGSESGGGSGSSGTIDDTILKHFAINEYGQLTFDDDPVILKSDIDNGYSDEEIQDFINTLWA